MFRVSFLSSGSGYTTATVLRAIQIGVLKNIIPVSIISDRESKSLDLASKFHIKPHLVNYHDASSREQFSDNILHIFKKENIDVSFLTFDRILSGNILKSYKNKLINIHPSLLPSFPGYGTINQAIKYGTKFIGATCHFIDAEMDHGPIINQAILPLNDNEHLDSINQKLYKLKQQLALESLYAFCTNLITVKARNVRIKTAQYDSLPINPTLSLPQITEFLRTYDK